MVNKMPNMEYQVKGIQNKFTKFLSSALN